MRFTETKLEGAFVIEIEPIEDERGFFARGWCAREIEAHGLNPGVLQTNIGFSPRQGTLRGLHFQLPPHAECKLIRCTRGAIYNVIIDLRLDSRTRGHWFSSHLTADNHKMVYSPEGFAQGYQTLCDDTEICYQTTRLYAPDAARGVRYDDPAFSIEWPLEVTQISPPDTRWPDYADQVADHSSDLMGGQS
jgi:dTDP-4-dehydrorhamnose 3,5-epimerase